MIPYSGLRALAADPSRVARPFASCETQLQNAPQSGGEGFLFELGQ